MANEKERITLGDIIGYNMEEEFVKFDITEIQLVLADLRETDVIDLAHAEYLQQKTLRCADLLTEYLGRVIKTVGYLESKINSVRNKVALEYKAPDGSRTTSDMKKWASESSPDVEIIQVKLAVAKASKIVLEKKFDIIIRLHHYYKEMAAGLRRTILGYSPVPFKAPEGYE